MIPGQKKRKTIPFEFILEALACPDLHTRPMFGCTAVYIGEKIMLVLRKKNGSDPDTGVWVCIPDPEVDAMKREFPMLRGVSFFENENSAWQVLHESEPDFEEICLAFCRMVRKNDQRIGRIPKQKKMKPRTNRTR
jgi:hypothetical protein